MSPQERQFVIALLAAVEAYRAIVRNEFGDLPRVGSRAAAIYQEMLQLALPEAER